jgi:hypothetical protein
MMPLEGGIDHLLGHQQGRREFVHGPLGTPVVVRQVTALRRSTEIHMDDIEVTEDDMTERESLPMGRMPLVDRNDRSVGHINRQA